MQSLIFFNKEGDNLNFIWDDFNNTWNGDLIFHQNSDDTFKTIGLYVMERIPSTSLISDFRVSGATISLNKFQLFNEYGINFYGSTYSATYSVLRYEQPNSDPKLYSKWIHGVEFDKKFPVGSAVRFIRTSGVAAAFGDFTYNDIYTVHKVKSGAILLLGNFANNNPITVNTTTLNNTSIQGVNLIGVNNYLISGPPPKDNLSYWSEPQFYRKYFVDRKLNIINSKNNNTSVTVKSLPADRIRFRYTLDPKLIIPDQDFIVKVTLSTDVPTIYTGNIQFLTPLGSSNYINFGSLANTGLPRSLKPGTRFSVVNIGGGQPPVNLNFLTVAPIRNFTDINSPVTLFGNDYVLYEGKIYVPKTPPLTLGATSAIFPTNGDFWKLSDQLPVLEPIQITPPIPNAQVQLASNVLYYTQTYTQSTDFTVGSSIERFSPEIKDLNINYYYSNNLIYCDLEYADKQQSYAKIEFYSGTTLLSSNVVTINEKVAEVSDILTTELNTNISENFRYDIVFTDIDEFGIEITINGQIYYQDVEFLYDGINVNLEQTIDQTIKDWMTSWYIPLANLGIIATLEFTGKEYSSYLNTISLQTEYPNVPLVFSVRVGTTANFYIPHSNVIINKLSTFLSINLNGIEYTQSSIKTSTGEIDYDETLSTWVETWSDKLEGFGIFVDSNRSMLLFGIKEQDQRFELVVRTGVISLPSIPSYTIVRKIFGNLGCLISSNSIFLDRGSRLNLEGGQLSTGQLITINGSTRPYNNQEYNIEFLGSQSMTLSYKGPFWSTIDPFCDIAPFSTLALANGFDVNGCTPSVPKPASPGDFIKTSFQNSFQFQFGASNSYTMSYVNSVGYQQFFDIKYINNANRILILSGTSTSFPNDSRVIVYNSKTNDLIDEIILPQSGTPKFMKYNPFNNYLYCITGSGSNPNNANEFQKAYVVDPYKSTLDYTFTFSHFINDARANDSNGDMYFTSNSTQYSIWSATNFVSKSSTESNYAGLTFRKMEYHPKEASIYITVNPKQQAFWIFASASRIATQKIDNPWQFDSDAELFYAPWDSSMLVVINAFASNYYITKINEGELSYPFTIGTDYSPGQKYFSYDTLGEKLNFSYNGNAGPKHTFFKTDGTLENNRSLSDFGPIVYNPYDGDTYIASQGNRRIVVMDKFSQVAKRNIDLIGIPNKIIYNPDRRSVFGIVRTPLTGTDLTSKYFEVDVNVSVNLVTDLPVQGTSIQEDKWGTLASAYSAPKGILYKTREYVRRPRANFNNEPEVELIAKWSRDDVKDIFLYDFSGDQLSPTASVPYTGPKPFPLVTLNRKENTKADRSGLSEFQQTIFESLKFSLDKVDEPTNTKLKPTPIEIFVGSNSKNEGVLESTLVLYKKEYIDFTIVPTSENASVIQFYNEYERSTGRNIGYILINNTSTINFGADSNGTTRGLKPGQILKISISDATNLKNKYISLNNGIIVEILEVSAKVLKVICRARTFVDEFTQIDNYPKSGNTTYLQTRFEVLEKIVARFNMKTQTEVEDIRYKIELGNTGHLVNPSDTYIYKSYDINEQGIDWNFLNKKRKEMLMVRHDIFPYIGAYKSIINAINYFGYNDLELYEYYRNTDITDPKYTKLFKVEIPDIFDNSIKGWNDRDFLKYTLPNPRFEETNLFNLTFKITDKEGTNILLYSLAEVLMKLQGLKYWLETKIIPITHRILDITGRADFVGGTSIVHRSYDATILNVKQDFTPIDFALTEAYQSPVNSGSPVYTCRVEFFIGPVATQSLVPEYFKFKIRTYKTHKEWNPTTPYKNGEIVSYYGKFFTNVLNFNRLKNPRKYENVASWSSSVSYEIGQYANYDREIYQYINATNSFAVFGENSTINPFLDIKRQPATASWFYMTEWKLTDMYPVQNLSEFRLVGTFSTMDELPIPPLGQNPKPQMIAAPFNFTIDSNLDPFVTIEVTSDNGYGQNYTFKKYYEIRGLKDLTSPLRYPDQIGPFIPIVQLTNPIN